MAHMMVQPRPRRALKTFFIVLLVILLLLLACAGFFVVKALVSPTSAFSSTVPILPDADGDTSDPEAKQLAALEDKGYAYNEDIVNKMQKRVITLHKGQITSDARQGGYLQ